MATNVQGSASSIGMAPANTSPGAGNQGAASMLPQLGSVMGGGETADPTATGGVAPGGVAPGGVAPAGAPATGGAATQDPAAAGAAAGGAAPGGGFEKYLKHGTWLGPLLTIGGGIAAIMAFSKGQDGSKFLKFGGTSAAIAGVGLTALGFQAKGAAAATLATQQQAIATQQQIDAQYQAQFQQFSTEAVNQVNTLKQQLAAAEQQLAAAGQQGGQQPGGQTGQAGTDGGGTPNVGVGLNSTVVPGGQAQVPGGTTPTGGTTAPVATGPWTIQTLVNHSVQLEAGAGPDGVPIAEPGVYKIEQVAGDPNGYATVEEANRVTRQSMSTELMGSKFLRWMVVEHGGRFYGAVAKLQKEGAVTPLKPEVGNVVAWSAMNHISGNGTNGWKAYSWSQAGGAQSMDVPYGSSDIFATVAGGGGIGVAPVGGQTTPAGTQTGTVPTLPGTNIPVPGATPGAVTGGGPVAAQVRTPFDPASQVGRSFAINASNTAEGDLARGGVLQVQKFVDSSAGGFGTAEEAATAARAARKASGGDQWTRWVSLQGSDGRFYVYQGSIVKRPTTELQSAPVHVFGVGFAEFFDAATNSWKAVRDAQAA